LKAKKITVTLASIAIIPMLIFTLSYKGFFENEKYYQLKELHKNLFDLYMPNDDSLTLSQKAKRIFYREVAWYKIKNNKQLVDLLDPISNIKDHLSSSIEADFQDIIKKGFTYASPDRHDEFRRALVLSSSPQIKKYLFKLRQTWLYITYSTPLTEELANIPPKEKNKINDINLNLPKSKLELAGKEVIHKEGEIDYLIIGSGAAASVIAYELTRKIPGAKIVMIEAGSFVKPLSTITEASFELMESNNDRRTISGGIITRNGATVGGGTTVNLDLAFSPLLPQIKTKLQNWVQDDRLPEDFFHNRDQDWQKLHAAYDWVTSYVHTRQVMPEEINDNNKLLKTSDPLATTYHLNERKPSGQKDQVLKVSAAEAFILPALKGGVDFKGQLSLIPNAKATRINFIKNNEEKRAVSINFLATPILNKEYVAHDINALHLVEGAEYTIKAKNIILSAGTLGSAELLLRSELENDNIGRGIVIHPSTGIVGKFDRAIEAYKGLSASVYAPSLDGGYFYEAMSDTPQYIAIIHPGSGKEILNYVQHYKNLGGYGIMLIDTVNDDNKIFLDPATGRVEVNYTISDTDKIRMRSGIKVAIKNLLKNGAQEVFIPTAENIFGVGKWQPFRSPENVDEVVDKLQLIDPFNFISSAHMQGSNKIGSDPKASVISTNFRVWDSPLGKEIANLYVCDSSIFPTSVGSNPMQSIYTIAKLFVDRL